MRFFSYKTCEKIFEMGITVPTKWWWAVDNDMLGQKQFYGLFVKDSFKKQYMTFLYRAYSFDDIPAILLKAWKKNVFTPKSGTPRALAESFSEMALIFSIKGWQAMEKNFLFVLESICDRSFKSKKK